jgi:hypothetical protein
MDPWEISLASAAVWESQRTEFVKKTWWVIDDGRGVVKILLASPNSGPIEDGRGEMPEGSLHRPIVSVGLAKFGRGAGASIR